MVVSEDRGWTLTEIENLTEARLLRYIDAINRVAEIRRQAAAEE